jgi:hypothetical protein
MADKTAERVSVGFSGGQVIDIKITDAKLKELRKALESADGWLDLEADEGTVSIDLRQVVFVRSTVTPQQIGFSA